MIYNVDMGIIFVRNDIAKIKADVIVNSANPYPVIGGGSEKSIYSAAGRDKLLKERRKIGNIDPGNAVISSGFDLTHFIIHAVGPNYIDGKHGEERLLRCCYRKCLELATRNNCDSIAFPLISTGIYGYPKEDAISIAISEINDYLLKRRPITVYISVFDDESYAICSKLGDSIDEKIDSNEIRDIILSEYHHYDEMVKRRKRPVSRSGLASSYENKIEISSNDRSFNDMLIYYLNIIDEKSSNIYAPVNIDRRLFSKIIKEGYHPSKETVIKLSFGLGLSLSQTIDFLSRADYSFNPSRIEDRIIYDCLSEKKSYKETLEELKQTGCEGYI